MNELLPLIERLIGTNKALIDMLVSCLKVSNLTKSSLILKPDHVSNHVYFIEKGLVRGYYLKDGKEITTGFMKEGQFALSPVSFFGQQPSFEFLQLLEDCTLHSITHKQLEQLYVKFPEFNKVGRLLVEQYYIRSELRTHQMRSLSATERYALCQSTYGAMLNRVSNDHLASLIGLTPETLSRVKSKKL